MSRASATTASATTASQEEVARFTAMAEAWWDPEGEFKPLHRFNPVRVGFVRDHLCDHFGRDPGAARPLEGLRILDVGSGGGILSEPVAELGAEVQGIDAGEKNVRIAALHAEQSGVPVTYRHALPEDLAAEGTQFDAVLAMEIVEHVADLDAFLDAVGALVKPGGALFLATLNRTPKSFALAKVGAEYLLRWLPPGTHDWKKFVKPSEMAKGLRRSGIRLVDLKGMGYDIPHDAWVLSEDLDVNYLAYAVKD